MGVHFCNSCLITTVKFCFFPITMLAPLLHGTVGDFFLKSMFYLGGSIHRLEMQESSCSSCLLTVDQLRNTEPAKERRLDYDWSVLLDGFLESTCGTSNHSRIF